MFYELTKEFGKQICIALYGAFAWLAARKKPLPLLTLLLLHTGEYFQVGRKIAAEHGLSPAEGLVNCLAYGFFQLSVTAAFKFLHGLIRRFPGTCAVNIEQILQAGLLIAVGNGRLGISDGTFAFSADRVRIIHQENGCVRVLVRLRHLLCRILQRHDARADLPTGTRSVWYSRISAAISTG